jgi:diaminohydroxyphosphoribosylaminopyrimidine deaminase/5-amino-6-(5-phosphoribosylamino)uracil reductase
MNHDLYMQRCIQLAKNGLGSTYPNPMVGAVIVCDGQIIGEGWHRKAGEPHAEVMAINQVKDLEKLKKSTIYVSLEPCSHFGKTPPCCDLIIAQNIPNVVVGCVDSNEKVAGKGIKRLKETGKNVTVGVLEKACLNLNKRFFTFHEKKRPFVILKWAETADGFMAPLQQDEKKPYWISNQKSRQLVHKWRAEEQAILVGHQTVINDNPALTTRDWHGQNPLRIVLSSAFDNKNDYHIFNEDAKTIQIDHQKDADAILTELYHLDIQSVIIEGGKKTLEKFISVNLWDEARIFQSNDYLYQGIKRPKISGQIIQKISIENNSLTILVP